MTTTSIMPTARQRYYNNDGTVAAGCYLYTYSAGGTTPKATYADSAGATPNANPVVLDAKGEALIYWDGAYKVDLKTAAGVQITGYPVDNYVSYDGAIDAVYTAFAATSGAALSGTIRPGSSVARTVQAKLNEIISINDFGAVADFNPSTGVGTDNRVFIQNALDYVKTLPYGATLTASAGAYYIGTGYTSNSNQLVLGSLTEANAAVNITLDMFGVTFYPGASGQALRLSNTLNCNVLGLRMVGYTGGTLDPTRESDALIALQSCSVTTIQNCYLTNCLGDDIYIGGDGQCSHIKILSNTLKERYGNGTRSFSSGSRSRLCIAVINAYNVDICASNTIIGGIDCENNLSSEYLKNIKISDNDFSSGHVTPQAVIGTAYWYDEPTAVTGGTVIDQSVNFAGVGFSASTHSNLLSCCDNRAEQLTVFFASGSGYRLACKDNVCDMMLVKCDDNSGTGVLYDVSNNTVDTPITGLTYIISLNGNVQQSRFHDNVLLGFGAPAAYVFDDTTGGVDGGYNSFSGNRNMSSGALGVFGFSPHIMSVYSSNWHFQQVSSGGPATNRPVSVVQCIQKLTTGSVPTVTVTTAAEAVDFRTIGTNSFILAKTGIGTLGSITNIENGTTLYIQFDSSAVTIKHNSSYIRMHSGADITSGSADSNGIFFQQGGVLREVVSNMA